MKNTFAIFFLLLYVSILFKSIYPYIDYTINKDYIATVLCINKDKPQMHCEGKCHLKKQLKKANDEQNNSKPNTPPKVNNSDNIFPHLICYVNFAFIHSAKIIHYSFITKNPTQTFFEPLTPPPKFV